MTKEQYEGTPELIFYCEYNPHDFEDRLEIPFTNEYDIKLDFSRDTDNQIRINVDLQPKESNVPKGFFGKNILNVTAIAGKNGVGKTDLLQKLILNDQKLNVLCFLLFSDLNVSNLYYVDKKLFYTNSNLSKNDLLVSISYFFNKKRISGLNYTYSNILIDSENKKSSVMKGFFDSFDRPVTNMMRWTLIQSEHLSAFFQLDIEKSCSISFGNISFEVKGYETIQTCLRKISYCQTRYKQGEKIGKNIFILLFIQNFYIKLLQYVAEYIEHNDENIRDWGSGIHEAQYNLENEYLSGDELKEYKSELKDDMKAFEKADKHFRRIEGKIDQIIEADHTYFNDIDILYEKIKEIFKLKIIKDNYDFKCLQQWLKLLNNIPNKLFDEREVKIHIENDEEQITKIIELIDLSNKSSIISDIVLCQFANFSSGEMQLVDTFSLIYSCMEQKFGLCSILLDEPDSRLHPEWSRRYISYLINFLDWQGERLSLKFQLILTTHSPYLISDLPKDNVVLLEKDEKTGKRTARKSNYGFASNYYDIMSDSFFLDDTIGEFAKQKINQVIKRLNYLSNLLDKKDSKSKKISNKFMQRSQLILDHVNPIIQLIGDPFIRQQLDRMVMSIQERLKVSCQPESKKELLEKQRAILEAQIKQIDQELGND